MKKTPQEKGFKIPVMKKIGIGRYRKAYAKALEPNKNGEIYVCFDSGAKRYWKEQDTIHVPQGFEPINSESCQEE